MKRNNHINNYNVIYSQVSNDSEMEIRHHRNLTNVVRVQNISDDFICKYEDSSYGSDPINNRSEEVHTALELYDIDDNYTCYSYNGVVVHTTHGLPIVLAMDGHQGCCERFGVTAQLPNELTRDDFIGATITKVKYGKEKRDDDLNISELIIETSVGNIVLLAENIHNGYYSHAVIACFEGKAETFSL